MKNIYSKRSCHLWGAVALIVLCTGAVSGCANNHQTTNGEVSETDETNLGQVTHEEIQSHINSWVEANDGEPIEIHIGADAYIGCPVLSVCDEDYDYRAFMVAESGFHLRLSFDGVIAREISLDLLREHFGVASLGYEPPELNFENWRVRLGGDVALRAGDDAVEFSGWEDGRAQGQIRTTLRNIYGYVTEDDTIGAADRDCFLMDTQVPDECSVQANVTVPLVLTFDLGLPTGTLDCSGSDRPAGCGNSIR